MAEEVENTAEETGGIVTTVKTEVSSDLDLKRMMEEQAGDGEETGEKVETPVKEEKKPVRSDRDQKEIDRLNKEIRLGRRDSKAQEDRIARLESLIEKSAEKRGPAPARSADTTRPVRPKAENFANEAEFEAADAEYDDKLYEWRKAQESQQSNVERARQRDAGIVNTFNEKVKDFTKTHTDYAEVMDSELELTPVMFGAVMEEGPELGYYFATHVDEAEKISAMDEKAQMKAITRILVKLEDDGDKDDKEEKPKSKPVAVAVKPPEPAKPNAGRGAAPVKERSQMTFKEREADYAKRHPGKLNYL